MRSILALSLLVAVADPHQCSTINPVTPPPSDFRFEVVYSETDMSMRRELLRDRKTGVEYLWVHEGEAGGLIALPAR